MNDDFFISLIRGVKKLIHLLVILDKLTKTSGWVIDFMEGHGILVPESYIGAGKDDEILIALENIQGVKYEWLDCGEYTIPIPTVIRRTIEEQGELDEFKRKVNRLFDWLVRYSKHDKKDSLYLLEFEMMLLHLSIFRTFNRCVNRIFEKNSPRLLKYLPV